MKNKKEKSKKKLPSKKILLWSTMGIGTLAITGIGLTTLLVVKKNKQNQRVEITPVSSLVDIKDINEIVSVDYHKDHKHHIKIDKNKLEDHGLEAKFYKESGIKENVAKVNQLASLSLFSLNKKLVNTNSEASNRNNIDEKKLNELKTKDFKKFEAHTHDKRALYHKDLTELKDDDVVFIQITRKKDSDITLSQNMIDQNSGYHKYIVNLENSEIADIRNRSKIVEEADRIKNLGILTFAKQNQTSIQENSIKVDDLQNFNPKKDFKYEITNSKITRDGMFSIIILVKKGAAKSEPLILTINVNTLNEQNLNNYLQIVAKQEALPSSVNYQAIKKNVQDFADSIVETIIVDENSLVYNDWEGTITFGVKMNGTENTIKIYNFYHHEDATSVPKDAYKNKTIPQGFLIPNYVTKIGENAFQSLTSLPEGFTLPEGLTSIGDGAFYSLTSIPESFTLPEGLTSIGKGAFQSLTSLPEGFTLPGGLTSIGDGAFGILQSLPEGFTLPEGLTSIGNQAFINLRSLPEGFTLPKVLKSIGNKAFNNLELIPESFTLPEGLTSIGGGAFQYLTSLPESFTLPKGLTSIGDAAFASVQSLPESFTLPEGLTSIGDGAFAFVQSLPESFTLPKGLTSIGDGAFHSLKSLPEGFTLPEGLTIEMENNPFGRATNSFKNKAILKNN